MINMTYVSLSKLKQVVVSSSFRVIFIIVILTFRIWVIVRVNIITLKTLETSNAKKETEAIFQLSTEVKIWFVAESIYGSVYLPKRLPCFSPNSLANGLSSPPKNDISEYPPGRIAVVTQTKVLYARNWSRCSSPATDLKTFHKWKLMTESHRLWAKKKNMKIPTAKEKNANTLYKWPLFI